MTRHALTTRGPSRRFRTARRLALAAGAALLVAGPLATPAAADNDLEDANPGSGARLREAPGEIRLEFDDLLSLGGSSISVSGPDGDATAGSTRVFGSSASRGLKGDLPDGRYTVSYSVNGLLGSGDAEGGYSFTIASGRSQEPAPVPAPTTPRATPKAEESATPTPTPTPSVARTKLAPAAVATAPPSRAPIASPPPPAAVPVPAVDGVSTKSREWLPPPVFWWGLIVMVGALVYGISKLRGGGRVRPLPGPAPVVVDDRRALPDSVLLVPDDATRPDGVPLQAGPQTPMTPMTTPLVPLDEPLHTPADGTPDQRRLLRS